MLFLPLAGFAVSISYVFLFEFHFHYTYAALIVFGHALLYLSTLLFIKSNLIFIGKHFLTINFLSEIAVHAFYLFPASCYFQIYFLVGLPLIYMLFSREQINARVTYSLIAAGLLFSSEFAFQDWHYMHQLTDAHQNLMKNLNLVSSFIVLMVAIYLFANLMEQAELTARQKSNTDFLTGLYNRRRFMALANQILELSNRNKTTFSLVFIDLDHFKQVNDVHGHDIGDKVLQIIASVLKENIRKTDILSRFGGEEFVVLFSNTNAEYAMAKAEVIRLAIANKPMPIPSAITASFGITEFTQHDSLKDLLKRADDALYEAKESGRNCIRLNSAPEAIEDSSKVTSLVKKP